MNSLPTFSLLTRQTDLFSQKRLNDLMQNFNIEPQSYAKTLSSTPDLDFLDFLLFYRQNQIDTSHQNEFTVQKVLQSIQGRKIQINKLAQLMSEVGITIEAEELKELFEAVYAKEMHDANAEDIVGVFRVLGL
ncbi:Hypothetical_protein [Hexamita inflata]|uniref:Hypothetical_protein n=1 Tax=Hexamita inflata TaxID=28002 RepID=A0AA86QUW1_9EUKA|nr:Hypothetical protein HINF_LOCUS54111 [Hexamita inflata]